MGARRPTVCSVSGFDASGLVTNADVRRLLRQLPTTHRDAKVLRSIQYVDSVRQETDPRRVRFTTYQVFGEYSVDEPSGEGHATIYRQHPSGNPNTFWLRHCILHELGHAVYHQELSGSDRAEWAKRHANAVTLYNAQSRAADEHFCNLYAAYVLRHEFVRARFGNFYSFLRERVFEGKEY